MGADGGGGGPVLLFTAHGFKIKGMVKKKNSSVFTDSAYPRVLSSGGSRAGLVSWG